MPARDNQQEDASGSSTDLLISPLESTERPGHSPNLPSPNEGDTDKFTQYEFIDCRELARRLAVPMSWIRDQVRSRHFYCSLQRFTYFTCTESETLLLDPFKSWVCALTLALFTILAPEAAVALRYTFTQKLAPLSRWLFLQSNNS